MVCYRSLYHGGLAKGCAHGNWYPPRSQVGNYLGVMEDVVSQQMIRTTAKRQSVATDEEAMKLLLQGESATHEAHKAALRSVASSLDTEHRVADSQVQNETEEVDAPPPGFMRGLIKDMQRKAMEDEDMENELLAKEKDKVKADTPSKQKPLRSLRMSLKTETMKVAMGRFMKCQHWRSCVLSGFLSSLPD